MEDYAGAIVTAQEIQPEGNKKKKIIILSLVVLSLIITTAGTVYLFQNISKQQSQKEEGEKIEPVDKILEGHPQFFLADIEYNPQTGTVIQRGTSVGRGDPPPFFSERPPEDPNRISYKVEVVTEENIILQSGWYSDYKQKVQTKENTLRFSAVAGYSPGATIKLYYPTEDKLIWIGKIQ